MTAKKPRFDSDESDLFPEDAAPSSPSSTRNEYIKRSASGYTKIRHAFVQRAPSSKHAGSKPSMLPAFARNHRAAVLYLAVLTNWTWLSRSEETLPADTWIRFLSSTKPGALTWTPQSLSHAWKTLEEANLVTRELDRRMKKIVPLNENGKGGEYERPEGVRTDPYFVLPHEFWSDELHATLRWPGLAVLLILLKESSGRDWAELAVDRSQKYYGISRTTAEEGLAELRRLGLLVSTTRYVVDHDAAEGRRLASLHVLQAPYSTKYRRSLQRAAQERRKSKNAAGKKAGKADSAGAVAARPNRAKRSEKSTQGKKSKRREVVGDEAPKLEA